jgi:peptide/nickel transport system permease protein
MTLKSARRTIGGGIILMMAAAAILAPWITGQDPNRSGDDILAAATARHWFGTDDLGRDVLTRVLYGARISLLIGTSAALVANLIGVPVGLVAGYLRGPVDLFLIHVIDLFIALPGLVLALIITVAVGPSLRNLVLVLGFVMWPAVARLIRGQVFVAREMAYIDAARSIGAHTLRVVARHVWPNISRVAAAQFSVGVASAIFTASSLSFLGLGLPPPTPDWGSMVQSGFEYLSDNPLMCLAPGAAVALTVLGFSLIGQTFD